MGDENSTLQTFFYAIIFLILLALPIVAILYMWNFNIDQFILMFKVNDKQNTNGNFTVEIKSGEDEILTKAVINNASAGQILEVDNPAVRLKINSANIDGPIVYGNDGEEMLKKGFWKYPATVFPGQKGISTIFGHRRYHLPPRTDTFYNLDKVKVKDKVEILLKDGKWLEYTVISTEVINPDQLVNFLNESSNESMVRLITCTPLGTANQRLVVTAKKSF